MKVGTEIGVGPNRAPRREVALKYLERRLFGGQAEVGLTKW